jgi:hypothetical protein
MTRIRTTILCLALGSLAVPASVGAGTVPVAPPEPGSVDGFSPAARAAVSSGCVSRNTIEFRGPALYEVRHYGRIRCEIPTRIRCSATLFDANRQISEIGSRGRDRCFMASSFRGGYPAGASFVERFRYRITLRREGQTWSRTTAYCPERTNHRRTLICRDSHRTKAPNRHTVTHD